MEGMGPVMSWKQRDHAVLLELETPKRGASAITKRIGSTIRALNGLFDGPCPSIVAATVLEKTRRGVDKVSLLGEHMLS